MLKFKHFIPVSYLGPCQHNVLEEVKVYCGKWWVKQPHSKARRETLMGITKFRDGQRKKHLSHLGMIRGGTGPEFSDLLSSGKPMFLSPESGLVYDCID